MPQYVMDLLYSGYTIGPFISIQDFLLFAVLGATIRFILNAKYVQICYEQATSTIVYRCEWDATSWF